LQSSFNDEIGVDGPGEAAANVLWFRHMLQTLSLWMIRGYQVALSPMLGNVCRFEPSCSRYAAQSIITHGFFLGSLLSAVRLCKCHPLHSGGFDPPPARFALRWRNNQDLQD
jgi:uncharacterized protein